MVGCGDVVGDVVCVDVDDIVGDVVGDVFCGIVGVVGVV